MIEFVVGDLTEQPVDAIVNAANTSLLGGGGVDGAIHRAGGPEILAECRLLGGCDTGDAKATTAGRLPARWVIHAVGPVWQGGEAGEAELLASAHRRSLEVARDLGARTVAFPAISCGIYGYPPELAAPVAIEAVRPFEDEFETIRFVFLRDALREVFERAAASKGSGTGRSRRASSSRRRSSRRPMSMTRSTTRRTTRMRSTRCARPRCRAPGRGGP